ncbi:MAG: cupin domain-containing protein [Actinomycetota bacterium]|nr:cupin domain-containing protein [Actinomycetota bacterium]
MRIVTPQDLQTRRGPDDWFTGAVWMDASPAGPSPDASVFRVFFEPGARTNWHTHPEGQILLILTGTCRVAREGEPPVDVDAGGVVYFAPNEKHWHGANPDSYMVHAAVNPAANSGGGTDWLEPVSDEQYANA